MTWLRTDAAHQRTEGIWQLCMSIKVANVWIGLKPMCPTGSIMFRTRTGMSTEFWQVEEYLLLHCLLIERRHMWNKVLQGSNVYLAANLASELSGKGILAMRLPRTQFHWLREDCTACETHHSSRAQKRKSADTRQFRKYQCPTSRAG